MLTWNTKEAAPANPAHLGDEWNKVWGSRRCGDGQARPALRSADFEIGGADQPGLLELSLR